MVFGVSGLPPLRFQRYCLTSYVCHSHAYARSLHISPLLSPSADSLLPLTLMAMLAGLHYPHTWLGSLTLAFHASFFPHLVGGYAHIRTTSAVRSYFIGC